MINIFYHQHSLNDYMQRLIKTFVKIDSSGLRLKSQLNIITDSTDVGSICEDVFIVNVSKMVSEQPTLRLMKEYANINDGYSLYIHSKGVSHPTSPNVQDWVDLMEYFLIERHKDCIAALDEGYDLVGVNYMEQPERHFSGNFWWARNSYLRTLPDIHPTDRLRCEMWVCSNPNAKIKSLHNSTVNHYHSRYPKSLYT